MTQFAVKEPVATKDPFVTVDAGLEPGTHTFQLQVVTADGRTSEPDRADVTILRRVVIPPGTVVRPPVVGPGETIVRNVPPDPIGE